MDLDAFFKEVGINEYAIVRIEDLSDADRSGPLNLVPSARSVIVFGTEIPVPVYEAPPREKTQKMLRIAESLDRTAPRHADLLICRKFPLRCCPPVPAPAGGVREDTGHSPAETNSCAGRTWHNRQEYTPHITTAWNPAGILRDCHRNGGMSLKNPAGRGFL